MATIPKIKQLRPSLHGHIIGLDDNKNLVLSDGKHGKRVAVSNPFNPAQRARLFDDFFGDLVADEWVLLSGSDAQALDPVISAGIGGMVRLTSGNSGVNMAADGSQICSGLNFQASNGDLFAEARIKLDAITNCTVFFGFTDIITLEMPIESAASANTITTNASNAVGLFYDSRMTDDNWWAAGVKADTDAVHVDSGVAPVAATYDRLRMELDTSGNAKFYINGNHVADVDNAITAATDVALTVAANTHTAATTLTDIDYLLAEMDR